MSETTKEVRETVNALMDCVDYICEKFDISDEEQKKALDYIMDEIITQGSMNVIAEKIVNAIREDGEYEIQKRARNRSWREKLDELVFDTKEKAMRMKARLEDYLDDYKWVPVGYLFELMDESVSYDAEYYGWKNLDRASVRRVINGWRLVLPRPIVEYSRGERNEKTQ